jgi:hypothetical protein
VFWLRSSGFIDTEWLAFNLDSTHFWNRGFLYLLTISLWFLYSSRKQIYKSELDKNAAFFFLLIGITLDNLGNLFGWYRTDTQYGVEWYDKFVHFSTSGFITGFFIVTFRNIFRSSSFALILIAAIGISILFGTLFEIGEYYSDLISDTKLVGGEEDIIVDSVMNTGGAAFGALCALLFKRKR